MFLIKSDLLRRIREKSALAMPICAAGRGVDCLLIKEGIVCGALPKRVQDDHDHYDHKDLCIVFHCTGSI